MYEEYYGLQERPFTLVPDPDFLYLSPQHKLAKAYLEYGLTQRVGFVVLTGEVGAGKTTLIKALLKNRKGNQRLGVLYQTSVGAEDLLELLLREFDVRGRFNNRATRLAAFNQFLITAYGRGEHVVLLVDEAQNLGPEALEELRLLSNLQTGKDPLLQVILVGQTGLRERLRHPSLRQLAQRVAVHYHLRSLDRLESKEYIRYRLARAGGSGIFTEDALDRLFEYTQGVPRRLNAWCDLALVAGFAEGRRELDADFIDTVVAAQGGGLEGSDTDESAAPTTDTAPEASTPTGWGGDNNLSQQIQDLSGRLTRLEGLVLEMTGQLVPLVTKLLGPVSSADAMPPDFLAALETSPSETSPTPSPTDPSSPAGNPKRWWSRLWEVK